MLNLIFGVLGGLSLFIFGMHFMSEGLQKSAGNRLRTLLETITRNPLIGVLVGTAVTSIIQSSSATTVMVVGLANAGLMDLTQAISIIMGATIGTTMTAQIIAFRLDQYAYPIAAAGFIIYFFPQRRKIKYLGQIIFGFGLLFIGLNTMTQVLKPLAHDKYFTHLILTLGRHKMWGVLVGLFMTGIVQSSSATIGVLQAIAAQPASATGAALIPLAVAIPILFGDNIGTTVTALLASIGANKNAKRAAAAHTLIKVFGTFIFMLILPYFIKFVFLISPKINPGQGIREVDIIKRQIANAHTSFNIINSLIWLPMIGALAFLIKKIVPGKDEQLEKGPRYLDRHILENPILALEVTSKELDRMGKVSLSMFMDTRDILMNKSVQKVKLMEETEEMLDNLQSDIIRYMSDMTARASLTQEQSVRLADLMRITGDIERIGDHNLNLVELAQYQMEEKIVFSDQAQEELNQMFVIVECMIGAAMKALETSDFNKAKEILEQEQLVDKLEAQLRQNHVDRLNRGTCQPKSAVCYVEILKNLERIADHCTNIAEAVLDEEGEI
ncbi:MAG: Na/Pi cotransporter family protein [Bacillota bacterium]